MLRCLAMAALLIPSWNSCLTLSGFTDFLRWEYTPRCLALAIPAAWRFLIMVLSNCAKAHSIWSCSVWNAHPPDPLNDKFSERNPMVTPLSFNSCIMFCRSMRLRASLSMQCTTTSSPLPTNDSSSCNAGRLAEPALCCSSNKRSQLPKSWRSSDCSSVDTLR